MILDILDSQIDIFALLAYFLFEQIFTRYLSFCPNYFENVILVTFQNAFPVTGEMLRLIEYFESIRYILSTQNIKI